MFRYQLAARAAVGTGVAAIAAGAIAVGAPPTHPGPVSRPGQHSSAARSKQTTTFYGGGATLPAIAYVGASQATTVNPATDPSAGSIFGYFESVHAGTGFSYCQTGSGYGRKVIEGVDAANNPCAALGASPTGFGGANAYADFAGSDAPLAQSDYSTFATDAGTSGNPIFGRGEYVQVPYIAGAVAIMYNNPDITGQQLEITPTMICKIADGQVTNWNAVPQNPADPSGPKWPSRPLLWTYRADSSGTTFSMSNYLSSVTSAGARKVCTGAGQTYGLNSVYDSGNNNISGGSPTQVLPSPLPAGATNANFQAGSGNPGVVACILGGTDVCYQGGALTGSGGAGSIGYAEASNALSSVNGSAGVDFAKVYVTSSRIVDPIADLPHAANTVTTLILDSAVDASVNNGRPGTSGGPDYAALTGVTTAGCVGLVDPQSYEDPSTGYPIMAVTNLEFSSAGNSTKHTDLQLLAKIANDSANFGTGKITGVDKYSGSAGTGTTGYSTIRLPTAGSTSPRTIANCIGS